MDKIEPTHAKPVDQHVWNDDAVAALDEHLESEPYLIRISAAKRLRDQAERLARGHGEAKVTAAHVASAISMRAMA
jgi:chlorophyllide a reductase subunit Z